jgi:hypothetical protein
MRRVGLCPSLLVLCLSRRPDRIPAYLLPTWSPQCYLQGCWRMFLLLLLSRFRRLSSNVFTSFAVSPDFLASCGLGIAQALIIDTLFLPLLHPFYFLALHSCPRVAQPLLELLSLSSCVLELLSLSICVLELLGLSICVLLLLSLSICVLELLSLSICVLELLSLSICVLELLSLSIRESCCCNCSRSLRMRSRRCSSRLFWSMASAP